MYHFDYRVQMIRLYVSRYLVCLEKNTVLQWIILNIVQDLLKLSGFETFLEFRHKYVSHIRLYPENSLMHHQEITLYFLFFLTDSTSSRKYLRVNDDCVSTTEYITWTVAKKNMTIDWYFSKISPKEKKRKDQTHIVSISSIQQGLTVTLLRKRCSKLDYDVLVL